MIEVYSGIPGSGKTYNVTKKAVKALRKGRMVFSNYPIVTYKGLGKNKKRIVSKKLSREMISDKVFPMGSLLIIDEGASWFSSRDWKEFKRDDIVLFTQHRHIGIDMYVIAQHPQRLDTVIREIANIFWWCEKFPIIPLFRLTGYYDFTEIASSKPNIKPKTRFSLFKMKYARCYDTTYYKKLLAGREMANFEEWEVD